MSLTPALEAQGMVAGLVVRRLEGHGDIVTCAGFLPDGRQAVTASYDRTLRL